MSDERREGESRLSRWSARKRAARAGVEIDEVENDSRVNILDDDPESVGEVVESVSQGSESSFEPVEPSRETEEEKANREAAEAFDLDTLRPGDDFRLFLKRGVPEILKRRAMRRLWASDPVFANLDGLNDYDEDFRNPAHAVYKSIWQVGQGFLTKAEHEAQQATGRLRLPEEEHGKDGEESVESDDLDADDAPVGEAVDISSAESAEHLEADEDDDAAQHENGPAEAKDDEPVDEPAMGDDDGEPDDDDAPRRVSIRRRMQF